MKNLRQLVLLLALVILAITAVVQNSTIQQQRTELLNQLQTVTNSTRREGIMLQYMQELQKDCKK